MDTRALEFIATREDLANYHQLGGYLYSSGICRSDTYRDIWQKQFVQNEATIRFLAGFDDALAGLGIFPVLLKGASLLDTVYTDLGRRALHDVDLFVVQREVPALRAFLLAQGFAEFRETHWQTAGYATSFVRGNMALDIHQGKIFCDEPAGNWKFRPHPKWKALQILSAEDQLVHLAGHWGFQNGGRRLYSLFDMMHSWGYEDICLETLFQSAREKKRLTPLLAAFSALSRVFSWSPENLAIKKRFPLLSKKYLLEPSRHPFQYLVIKNFMYDSWHDALGNDAQWIKHYFARKRDASFTKT